MTETRLLLGDCLKILPTLPDSSVNLIATDPPYYRVKNEPWDRQWDSADGFLAWLDRVLAEFQRVLAANGSLYLFASGKMGRKVADLVERRFNVLNEITWSKPEFSTKAEMFRKDWMRSYFPTSERIIFAEHYGADNAAKGENGWGAKCDELRGFIFEPLRAYLDGERRRAGVSFEQVRQIVGCAAGSGLPSHWFTQSQWMLPTAENYAKLRQGFHDMNHGGDCLRREYEDLRRPFNATPERPYTDVWDFPTVSHYPGKHPCEKPLALMEHIVLTSSRPGDVVLDAFQGSGTTGDAATKHGRHYIGIEASERWHQRAHERVAQMQPRLEGLG